MPLKQGDVAPGWTRLAVVEDKVTEVTLESLLFDRASLVLTTYVFDFTGG